MRLPFRIITALFLLLPAMAHANIFEAYYQVRCLPEIGTLDIGNAIYRGRMATNAVDTPAALKTLEGQGIYHRAATGTCSINNQKIEWKVAFSPSDCQAGKPAAMTVDLTVDDMPVLKGLPLGYQKRDGGLGQVERIVFIPNYDAGMSELWFYGYWKPGALTEGEAQTPLTGEWLNKAMEVCKPGPTQPCNQRAENVWALVENGLCNDKNRKSNALTCAAIDLKHAEAEITLFFQNEVGQMPQAEQDRIVDNYKTWKRHRDETCKVKEGAKPDLKTLECLIRETRIEAGALKAGGDLTPIPASR